MRGNNVRHASVRDDIEQGCDPVRDAVCQENTNITGETEILKG
jgi:hypothetical protein